MVKKLKKTKGGNKNVVKNISHKKCVDVLFNNKLIRHKMKKNQSNLHRIGTYNVCKFLFLVLMIKDAY